MAPTGRGKVPQAQSQPGGWPSIGVSLPDTPDDHTALYLALVSTPSASRNDFYLQGFSGEYVDRVMSALVARGLARTVDDDTWEALPPDLALPALAARLEQYASTIRASTSAVARAYANRAGKKPDPSGYERLRGIDQIAAASQRIVKLASERVASVRSNTAYTRYLIDLPIRFHSAPLLTGRGAQLESRVTVQTSVLVYSHTQQVLRVRAHAGEQHRFLPYLPFSALVTDRGMAVVDLDGPDGPYGLSITIPEAAVAIGNVCEWAWRLATPWQLTEEGSKLLDGRDRRILEQLAIGTTDSVIARSLGVSQRTVERRVRELMVRLGAETRFQAGVQAAKSGLI